MKKIVACTLAVLAANVALFVTDYAGGRPRASEALLSPAQNLHQHAPIQLADEAPLRLSETAQLDPTR